MGAAAAYALAERGAQTHLFEQFDLHHAKGSSHGASRLFRTAYFEHPDYVPLLKRAAARWRALEAAQGKTLFHRTGLIESGPLDSALMSGVLKASDQYGLPLNRLTVRQARARMPWFAWPDDYEIVIEEDAGMIRADRALAALIDGARANGAIIAGGVRVLGWTSVPDGIELATEAGTRTFDRLVLTPGAWAASVLGEPGGLVRPLRKHLFWAATDDKTFTLDAGFSPFAIERSDGRFFYGFPVVDGDGLKIGEHTGGAPLSAPEEDAPADKVRAGLEQFLRETAPGLPQTITKEQACLYAMSPDGHFLIDAHPADPRVVFAAGFSGHGFKFAPVIGEALADLALTGETLREFDFLKLARLGAVFD